MELDRQDVETTVYSLTSDVPADAGADRRKGVRHMTLFRVGSILVDGQRELCLIKNISAGGMKMRAYRSLEVGAELTVELKCGQHVDGTVSWVEGDNVGVAFDKSIDVIDILSHSMEGPRPRMPRVEINCPVVVHIGGKRHEAIGVDVSQGGIKLDVAPRPAINEDIVVTLPGMTPVAGVVKWAEDDFVGVTFNSLMPLSGLVSWLGEQRETLRKAG
ncbi:PilZ domain-containing protein [Sphingomicrobium lutaoense]|uniref:PilZ domain-containing protein n=1 Tax=Sphingomicrobium lutaoense TaxID=515949 RepID=A0A839Z5I7_9SPHN|nr:PilZ domain-containing protein [Sphingomicrobium lutaoense]MBB3763944.1 hypothetical protein [Sphingomicrobium lutaoense]